MHHGVLAVTVVEETIVCTPDLSGKASGRYLTVDALKESSTVKINKNPTFIPQLSQPLFWFNFCVLIELDWFEIRLSICLRLVLESKDDSLFTACRFISLFFAF